MDGAPEVDGAPLGYRLRVPATETSLRDRLPWVAVLVTLATAAVLLFGPLWDDARDENPLLRPPGPDWDAILTLGLPTVMVAAALGVALALPRHVLAGALGLVVLGYAVVRAPGTMTAWFLPALGITAVAWALAARDLLRRRREA